MIKITSCNIRGGGMSATTSAAWPWSRWLWSGRRWTTIRLRSQGKSGTGLSLRAAKPS